MKSPQLATQRLILHELGPRDAEAIYSYRTLPEVWAYQSWRPGSILEVQEYIARSTAAGINVMDTWFQLGMYLRSDGRLVGDVGLHFLLPDNQQTEIGFTTSPDHQRKGYAFEAVAAVFDCLFTVMGKHRIIGSVDPMNAASIALLEKLGMRREGCFKKSVRIRNQWEDDIVYALLDEEWPAKKAGLSLQGT